MIVVPMFAPNMIVIPWRRLIVLDTYIILAVMIVVEDELRITEIRIPSSKTSKSELGNKKVIFSDSVSIDSSIIDNE